MRSGAYTPTLGLPPWGVSSLAFTSSSWIHVGEAEQQVLGQNLGTEGADSAPRVLVTRPARQSGPLVEGLRALGLQPVVVPCIRTVSCGQSEEFAQALEALDAASWLLLTSTNGVAAVLESRAFAHVQACGCRVGVVGPATRQAAEQAGLEVDLMPMSFEASALAAALQDRLGNGLAGVYGVFVRAREGREVLPEMLRGGGMNLITLIGYETQVEEDLAARLAHELAQGPVQVITLASPSAAQALAAALRETALDSLFDTPVASLGRVTAEEAQAVGFVRIHTAPRADLTGLLKAVVACLGMPEA